MKDSDKQVGLLREIRQRVLRTKHQSTSPASISILGTADIGRIVKEFLSRLNPIADG